MNAKVAVAAAAVLAAVAASALYGMDASRTVLVSEPVAGLAVMETDGVRHSIPLEKIRSGGPAKDGIPSIDAPVFTSVADSQFVSDSDIVMGIEIGGQARAYPLFILVWHEIVNDVVGGTPVSVTYCPLCYTSQVFERVINGSWVEFGTSGKLYNSNLLMYDRLTDSYWSQALGVAVLGPLTGHELDLVPFDLMEWGDWKVLKPHTLVLSTDTGFERPYATDPYGNYYTEPRILFPVENIDERLPPKEIIIGFGFDGVYKAYRQGDIESGGLINDDVGGKAVALVSMYPGNTRAFERTVGGMALDFELSDGMIADVQTGSVWSYDGVALSGSLQGSVLERLPTEPGFWFEWTAFHPGTLVYEP